MPTFKQLAYYVDNKLSFIDRTRSFKTKQLAEIDLERFACRTENRIQNRQYVCVVKDVFDAKNDMDLLANKLV